MIIDDKYKDLYDVAAELLDERYNPPVHSVAAALLTVDGEIITANNIDHFSGYLCAETAALSKAINDKEYNFEAVVAVRKNDAGETAVANMCGKCRQIFYDYAPGIEVVTADRTEVMVKTIDELLPFPFTRQREKIQQLIKKDVIV